MEIVKKFIEHDDTLYLILREIPISQVSRKDGSIIPEAFNAWRDLTGADKVLKNSTYFMYCEKIQEPEYEEIKDEPIPEKLLEPEIPKEDSIT